MSTEQILESAAKDGSIDAEEWPRVRETVLSRLEQIVHNDFQVPRIPPLPPPPPTTQTTQDTVLIRPEEASSQGSQSADKENAPPPPPPPSSPPRPAPTSNRPPDADSDGTDEGGMPQAMTTLYNSIRTALTKNFPRHPPHTIQRLAELVLRPRAHYRYLPSYLNALDRVISVSSDTTLFPLPQAVLPGSGMLNGTSAGASSSSPTPSAASSLGSDESLGGALLTPIPWLRPDAAGSPSSSSPTQPHAAAGTELRSESSEMVEGPNGTGRIETVSVVNGAVVTTTTTTTTTTVSPPSTSPVASAPAPQAQQSADASVLRSAGGVTQGELLRQEQEAGVVPATHGAARRPLGEVEAVAAAAGTAGGEEADETPHARGPEEMTMEDTGPTQRMGERLDIEAAVGRRAQPPQGEDEGRMDEGGEGDQGEAGAGSEGNRQEGEGQGEGAATDAAMADVGDES